MSRTCVRNRARIVLRCLAFAIPLIAEFDAAGQVLKSGRPPLIDSVVILAVSVNGLPGDLGVIFLEDADGRLFAASSFLDDWNLRPGSIVMNAADGTPRFGLAGIPGLSYRVDSALAEIAISASSEAFRASTLTLGMEAARKVSPYTPGATLSYDLSATQSPGASSTLGLIDVALFRGEGLLTGNFMGGTGRPSPGAKRLMTTWQTDRIDSIKTLRLGDSYNATGTWGRGVLFGGIQYGTNFAIRPDYVPFAQPSVSGKALLPSTVDVYVNNALRSRQQVSAGPFSIQNLPVVTGTGEMQIVVKDALGREQLITQSFFSSPTLLREGLVQDSFEFGWLRENYGLRSNDYSDPFATATYRRGLNNRLTGEARLELQRDVTTAGASVAARLPAISSVVESSVAVSRVDGLAPGAMGSVSLSFLGRRVSASGRLQLNSLTFRQLGSNPASLPQQVATLQLSAPVGNGTLSVNYLRHLNQGESMVRLVNVGYSHKLARNAFLSFTLIKPLTGHGAASIGATAALTLTYLFDEKHIGSSTINTSPGSASLYTDFQKATPRESGTGYRLAALNGGATRREEMTVSNNQSFGSFQADAVSLNDDVSTRFNVRGGVATLGDGVFFSRNLDQGFAIVQTRGIPDVPVYVENQVVGRTDRRGLAVVSNLRPYQENRVRIDPVTLPLEASIRDIEETVVPRSRGGVLIDFEVLRVRSATLTILQADGTLLPPWTPVEVVGMKDGYVSGNRGEVSLDLPRPTGNRVIARPDGGPVCELSIDQPEAGSVAPFLAPLSCPAAR